MLNFFLLDRWFLVLVFFLGILAWGFGDILEWGLLIFWREVWGHFGVGFVGTLTCCLGAF